MGLRQQWAERAEHRASNGDGGYTSLIVGAVEQAAAGTAANAAATAAVETAAGMIGRALSLADVACPEWARSAISPRWLRRVGYDLVATTAGHLSVVDVVDGMVTLEPASTWTWYGQSPSGSDWRVLAQLPRPTGDETRTVPASAVVAVGWSESRFAPWYGLSPIARAKSTADLLAQLDTKLGAEAAGQVGHLVQLARARARDGESFDGRYAALDELHGRTVAVPPTGGYDPAAMPRGGGETLKPHRVGADPPEPLVALQENVFGQVLAACGVPPGLVGQSNGSQAREDYRRFALTTVEPLGQVIAQELADKLECDVRLTFPALAHADIAGRARSAATLVRAGWTPQEAARAAGLDEPAATAAPEPGQ